MALDKLKNLSAEQKAKLEAALKEIDVSVDEISQAETERAAAVTAKAKAEESLAAVEKDWQDAYAEFETISKDKESSEKEKAETRAEIEKARREKVEAEAKLRDALARKPDVDTSKFMTLEAYQTERQKDARNQTAYWGDTLDAVAEVERVTKQRVSPKTLIQEAIAAGKTPLAYAEEKYKLQEERDKSAKEQREKERKEDREAGRRELLAEMANPATRTLEDSSSPLYVAVGDKAVNPWDDGADVDPGELELKSMSPGDFDREFLSSVKVAKG